MDSNLLDSLAGLIVSCQASAGEPLNSPEHLLAMALSGLNGGGCALRLEGLANIAYIRAKLEALYDEHIPIVGLTKADIGAEDKLSTVYITATFEDACKLSEAGADIIALDATGRKRLDACSLKETIEKIHSELAKPVWADCATFSEGINAANYGADIVSTTLYGYTEETALPGTAGPSFDLLKELVRHLAIPVILEGRIWHPEEVTQAFEIGAHGVVVGSAITRPQLITERFVRAIPPAKSRLALKPKL